MAELHGAQGDDVRKVLDALIEHGAFPAEYDIAAGAAGFLVTAAGQTEPEQQALASLQAEGIVEVINQTASHQMWRLTEAGLRQLRIALFAKCRPFLRHVAWDRIGHTPWLELTTYELFAALRKEKFNVQVLGSRSSRKRLAPYNGENNKNFYVRARTRREREKERERDPDIRKDCSYLHNHPTIPTLWTSLLERERETRTLKR